MKSLIILFYSIALAAQNPYPDTLFLMDGRSYPCLITSLNESNIGLVYLNGIKESIIIQGVKRLSLEDNGTVYLTDTGFNKDINILNEFIGTRNKKIEKDKLKIENQERLPDYQQGVNEDISYNEENKHWSFGVLYVPYYSGTIYRVVRSSYPYYPLETYGYAINETNMEAQLTYEILSCIRLTLDVGYNSTYTETRYEEHNQSSGSTFDYGALEERGIKLLDITFGFKYYFADLISENVSIYMLAGVGKQFAFAKDKYENLYPQGTSPITVDNMEEYLEDLNSPLHFNFGFGAEYFFNEALSLTSNIRFIYSEISAKYNYRYIAGTERRTRIDEYNNSEFITRIGLGLNFYF